MKAIILAAGVSRRMYPATLDTPKSLLPVDDKPLINYSIEIFKRLGINEIIVVVGYYREMFMEHLKSQFPDMVFHFVINHHFFETNTAYSVFLCRHMFEVPEITLLLNGDVLFPQEALQRLLKAPQSNVLTVEKKSCGNEEVKVIEGTENRIVAIGKELIQENALGEFIGLAKFSADFMKQFFISLEHLIEAGGKADYFEAAMHPILSEQVVHYIDVTDLSCIEIDFEEDLRKAEKLVQASWYQKAV
ncbi:MAG: phosphocholine cytidylyltransferase family protein [Candidatus Neomarinimicrobiota bacterium]